MVKDDNFHEFVDTTVIDNVTEEPMTTVEDSSDAVQEKKTKSESLEAVEEIKSKSEAVEEKKSKSEALLAEPELVVSVVTTKSVVNNTVCHLVRLVRLMTTPRTLGSWWLRSKLVEACPGLVIYHHQTSNRTKE
jgi:hypothetical protein